MSAEAVGWVYRFSPYTGAAFAVHLAVADTTSDVHGYEFWMALGKLGRKARVTRRATQMAIQQMADDGLLELVWQSNGGRSRPSRYRMVMPPDQPMYYEPTAPEGDPALLRTEFTDTPETVNGARETVNAGRETATSVRTHLTQVNPTEPGESVRLICCEKRFASVDDLADHQESGQCREVA